MGDVGEGERMEMEPAVAIGEMFADRAMVKTWVAAGIGVAALAFRFTAGDRLVEDITTLITMAATVATVLVAQRESRRRALAQAAATRERVYAPATVARLVGEATETAGRAAADPGIAPGNSPTPLHCSRSQGG